VYLTNDFKHSANTIADIYKQRWQPVRPGIELFFKALKHNLKIKTFWGTSRNAVFSQVWVALICYLLMSVLKYKFKFEASVGKLIQRIRSYIFETGDILRFLKDKTFTPAESVQTNQLTLCLKAGQ
jgi:putative transposase